MMMMMMVMVMVMVVWVGRPEVELRLDEPWPPINLTQYF